MKITQIREKALISLASVKPNKRAVCGRRGSFQSWGASSRVRRIFGRAMVEWDQASDRRWKVPYNPKILRSLTTC